jgi:hypothetical protein
VPVLCTFVRCTVCVLCAVDCGLRAVDCLLWTVRCAPCAVECDCSVYCDCACPVRCVSYAVYYSTHWFTVHALLRQSTVWIDETPLPIYPLLIISYSSCLLSFFAGTRPWNCCVCVCVCACVCVCVCACVWTVKLWSMRTRRLEEDLPGHADEVYAVDWAPDGGQSRSPFTVQIPRKSCNQNPHISQET